MKRMSRFQPPVAVGRDAAERHYAEVHHPFARRLFRDHGDQVHRYVANRADWQYSLNGRFEEAPSAWRFVITEVDDAIADASAWIPSWAQPLIWRDHDKCIQGIEAWEVDEQIVVDHRCGQLSTAKYLFLHEVSSAWSGQREHYLASHVPAFGRLLDDAFGARLYTANVVRRQAATSDEHGPGASYTGAYRDAATVVGLDEVYFDNGDWAAEFFGRPEVVALLRDGPFGRVEGYQVHETVGVDKRQP